MLLFPREPLARLIPLLAEQRAGLFPVECGQALRHRCAAPALPINNVVEYLVGRREAEVSEHHRDGSISPLLLLFVEDDKGLSHIALGLQAVVRVHPERAVLHQWVVNALAFPRRNRRLRHEGHTIHGIGKNQPMPMHCCRNIESVDQLEIDAVVLCRGVSALAVQLANATTLDRPPQNRQWRRCHFKHNGLCIARPLKRPLTDEPFPGGLSLRTRVLEKLQTGTTEHSGQNTQLQERTTKQQPSGDFFVHNCHLDAFTSASNSL